MKKILILLPLVISLCIVKTCKAQRARNNAKALFHKLDSVAIVKRLAMIPMRDGIKLATNIYRPKTGKKVPIIFVKTPYNFNKYRDGQVQARTAQDALYYVKHGFAYVIQNQRGRYYSQGVWHDEGAPLTDASDMFKWLRNQPWTNGKIGLVGCSSTAEWQLAAASIPNPADVMIPESYASGIGQVGEIYQNGNFFRGGEVQIYKVVYLGGSDLDIFRPSISPNATHEDLLRISHFYDLSTHLPPVDWNKAIKYLPIDSILYHINYPKGMYDHKIRLKPADPFWRNTKVEAIYSEGMPWKVPSMDFVTWYDIGVTGPLKLYNYVRNEGGVTKEIRDNQYLIIAPMPHCSYGRATKNTVVGQRYIGDARFPYEEIKMKWLNYWLKGKKSEWSENTPKVQYYTMGSNKWQSADTWPPKTVKMVPFYLKSHGSANSLNGDGKLTTTKPKTESKQQPDTFTYDPMNPVPTIGGGACCAGGTVKAGAYDQRDVETRSDVLVYTTPPLKHGVEVTGYIQPILYLSSDVKDTDITVRLVDVYPDGTAYNLIDTIFDVRYRKGYNKEVFMKDGHIYEIKTPPLATSNYFKKGHRIRIAISSSNFPHYARNLNTGGNNYDESDYKIAHNTIRHSAKYPSRILLPIKIKTLPENIK